MKAFDMVNITKLCALAVSYGFPLVILRLSVNSYSWIRRLVFQANLISKEIKPTRGILAGSQFATSELMLYLLEDARAFVITHPHSTLSIHVDDFAVLTQAYTIAEVVHQHVTAMPSLVCSFQQELNLTFSKVKSGLVATSQHLLTQVSLAMFSFAGKIDLAVKNLGVDFYLDQRHNKLSILKQDGPKARPDSPNSGHSSLRASPIARSFMQALYHQSFMVVNAISCL